MKTVNKRLIGLIVIAIIQLSFPFFFIAAKESILENGKEFMFRIEPVDPYDFFQGRYIDLNVSRLTYKPKNVNEFQRNDIVYAEFQQDTSGVKITALSHQKSKYSLKLKLNSSKRNPISVRLPFKRFYLEENKAKNIESIIRTNGDNPCFVHVMILDGDFVIKDISSKGRSLVSGKTVKKAN